MPSETNTFVRKLAHNDASVRNAAFKALCNYLKSKSSAKLDLLELEKLWRGLYFSMWYCDKPIPQQNLAGHLGELFSKVVPDNKLKLFHQAFWEVMAKEWYSLDKWRIDKFYMLVRRVLRHQLFRLEAQGFPKKETADFLDILKQYPLKNDTKFPQSLAYHVCDIYLDEIEYVIFKDFRDYSQEDDVEDEEEGSSSDDEKEEDSTNEEEEKEEKPEKAELSEEEIEAKKTAICAKTPLATLVEPFQELEKSAKNKAMRAKCKEEVTEDERLKKWGVLEDKTEESEDEWTGF